MKYRYAIHPEDYRVGENEGFYTDMAGKGWRLEKRGQIFSRFVKAEPRGEVYRIEIDYSEFSDEKLDFYEDCGWEYVTRQNYVNVFRSKAGYEQQELYADPKEQAETVRRMRRRSWISDLLALPVLIFVLLLPPVGDYLPRFVKLLVAETGYALLLACLLVYIVLLGVAGAVRIELLYRSLKRGQPLDHTPKRRRPVHKVLFLTVMAACLVLSAAQFATVKKEDMPEKPDDVYITLEELGFQGERRVMFEGYEDNYVEHMWSPVADMVRSMEMMRLTDGDWVSLEQDIYDLRAGFLSKLLMEALMKDAVFDRDIGDYEELTGVEGYDRVLAGGMECLARSRDRVVRVYMMFPSEMSRGDRVRCFESVLEGLS